MLLSVPVELSTDHFELLGAAQDEGYISEELLASRNAWPAERFRQVVNVLLLEGIVWVDDHRGVLLLVFFFVLRGGASYFSSILQDRADLNSQACRNKAFLV